MIPAKSAFVLTILVVCGLGAYKHSLEVHSFDTDNEISRISLGDKSLRLIGPVAEVVEPESGLSFKARIDTGATRCSLHVAEWVIDDEFPAMTDNVGKQIRFRLANRRGETEWLTRRVVEVAMIRTSEEEEMRYLVPISLVIDGLEREVLVSLNDRSAMDFAMLVGRNYLDGEFIVDVSRGSVTDHFLASSSSAIARMAP
jgi:hypothetical protein